MPCVSVPKIEDRAHVVQEILGDHRLRPDTRLSECHVLGGVVVHLVAYHRHRHTFLHPYAVNGLVGLVEDGMSLSKAFTFSRSGAWPPPAPST